MAAGKFDIGSLLEDPRYLDDDPLLDILLRAPQAMREILANAGPAIEQVAAGGPDPATEAQLRHYIFRNPDTARKFARSREVSDALWDYRTAGNEYLRKLAFNARKPFLDGRSPGRDDLEVRRYVHALGLEGRDGVYAERSRMLIPVEDFGLVSGVESFVEELRAERGRAILPSYMIYSRHRERYSPQGYPLTEGLEPQTLIQVGEALMFNRRIPEEARRELELDLVRRAAQAAFPKPAKLSKGRIERWRDELAYVMGAAGPLDRPDDIASYPSLFEALFQTSAYTVTVLDLMDYGRANRLERSSELGAMLTQGNGSGMPIFASALEGIVAESIEAPLGVVIYGWKGQSFADKVLIAAGYETILANEGRLKDFIAQRGEAPWEGPASRRFLGDTLRWKVICYGGYIKPYTIHDEHGEGIPPRDKKGEDIAWSVFGYFNGVQGEELQRLRAGEREGIAPRTSKFGLLTDWTRDPSALEALDRPNGYRWLNTTSQLPHPLGHTLIEATYGTNVDDTRGQFGAAAHASYKRRQQFLVQGLMSIGFVEPAQLYALRMLLSPRNTYHWFRGAYPA